jgi:hypothetical protein
VALAALALAVGSELWSARPLLIGLVALGLTVLAVDGRLSPYWLLPVGWLWVNSHGSFPLGVVYVLCVMVGLRLDGTPITVERRVLTWLVGGILAGVVNPLGLRLLLFPVALLQRQEVLSVVHEWQAPEFQSLGERLFLAQVALCLLALVRRPTYRSAVVMAVFLGASLVGSRNVPVASLVLLPLLASAWPEVGSMRLSARPAATRVGAGAVVFLALALIVGATRGPHFGFGRYPVELLELLEKNQVDLAEVRLGGPEVVGNLQELRGQIGSVFFDDRFDMFPDDVNRDLRLLYRGGRGATEVLDRWHLDLFVWRSQGPMTEILLNDDAWEVLGSEDGWHLFCRRGTTLSSELDC